MDSINMTNSPGLVSESCHESTFKLIRHHNFNDVLFSVGATWTFNKYNNGVHLSHSQQVAHVYYQLFDSKMADGDQLWSVPKLEYDLLRRNASTNGRKTDLIERYTPKTQACDLCSLLFNIIVFVECPS
jgi:hypothetical protein